ncbi:hypothetical protein BJ322DRAFT_1025878, partial [Thelephora terrestris]
MTSSCLISGIFELSTGMRCFPPYYATYSSSLKFIDKDKEVDCGISMQTYTPPSHDLYADKTFVWAAFNAALPASGEWIFDAISCIPLEIQQMPPKTSHIAVITGVIHSATEHGGIRSFFALSASEYTKAVSQITQIEFTRGGNSCYFTNEAHWPPRDRTPEAAALHPCGQWKSQGRK